MPPDIIDLRKSTATPSQEGTPQPPASHGASEEPKVLEWEALEFPERPKQEERWIGWTVAIATPLILAFLLLRNFLGIVLVVVGAFAFLLEAFRKPRWCRFVISNRGIEWNGALYPFQTLSSFWVFREPTSEKMLAVRTKKFFGHRLFLPLGNVDPETVRAALLPYLPEEKEELSPMEMWLRNIGY